MSPSGETPRRDELSQLLRQCVQCGLCLPHCATWQATGNDVLSPRGRLLILEDWLATKETGAQDAEARTAYVQAMDRCIGCRACETVCPSGVPFSLLAYGRQLADGAAGAVVRPIVAKVAGTLARRGAGP